MKKKKKKWEQVRAKLRDWISKKTNNKTNEVKKKRKKKEKGWMSSILDDKPFFCIFWLTNWSINVCKQNIIYISTPSSPTLSLSPHTGDGKL